MRAPSAAFLLLAACSSANPDPSSRDPYDRYLGALQLAEERDPVKVQELGKLLADSNPLARDGAVIAVGELGAKEHLPVVLEMLTSTAAVNTPLVRADACRTLAKLGGPEAQAGIAGALDKDGSVDVRRTAAIELYGFRLTHASLKVLVDALEDPSAGVSLAAHRTLTRATPRFDIPKDRKAWQAWLDTQPKD